MSFSISDNTVSKLFAVGAQGAKQPVESTGRDLYYHGNHIAQWKKDGLYISNGGYVPRNGATGSLSTKFLLNAIPGVSISTSRKQWSLNGKEWDGEWIKVKGTKAPKFPKNPEPAKHISLRTEYVRTDGWRGYSQPVNAAVGANDTGGWSDSPCPTNVATEELNKAAGILRAAGIKFKPSVNESSNVFCVHRYLVVSEADRKKAKELIRPIIEEAALLYIPLEAEGIKRQNAKIG